MRFRAAGGPATTPERMRIIPKLTLALLVGTCGVLGVNGYLRVRREIGFFEAERTREHDLMARLLGATVAAIRKSEGPGPARAALEATGPRLGPRMTARWFEGEAAAGASAEAGVPVTRIVRGQDGVATWHTLVPVDTDGVRRGAIELTEGATLERTFARSVLVDTVKTALAFALVSAVLSYSMGQWLLGRPVRALTEKARRTGRGDFDGPVVLTQRDELADLAREMNTMSSRLAVTLDQLRHADRLATVGKLASGIAHELGSPLNVVNVRASMIASGETTPEESRDYARVIGSACERMTEIIQQLLQFARRREVKRAPTDLDRLARDTADLLRPLAKRREVELRLAEPQGDSTALVDAVQAQQVVTNLVVNAMQAIPRGGSVTLRVAHRTALPPAEIGSREVGCVCLTVEDDGVGIAQEHVGRIFEPFFTTKDVGDGTGLGLSVAYGIVRDHGGWMEVQSEAGIGSTFTVFFPGAIRR